MVEFEGDLILGGNFTHAEKQLVNRIVRWDGTSFHPIGEGLLHAPREFAVHDGMLYAMTNGAETVSGGTSELIAFDGADWRPILFNESDVIKSMKVFDGIFYIGGFLTEVEGTPVNNVAQFDGERWSAIGTGIDTTVNALGYIGGQLVASVSRLLSNEIYDPQAEILKWDDTRWTSMGFVPPISTVVDFETYADELYVVGQEEQPDVPVFARWHEQSWQLLDLGTDHFAGGPTYDLQVHGGMLYAAGWYMFDAAHSYSTSVIFWNGSEWQDTETPFNGHVFALGEFNGDLIAGGPFTRVGTHGAYCVARLHSGNWQLLNNDFAGLGISGFVYSMCAKDSMLVVGGTFTSAGTISANNIAMFDGRTWHTMADGCGTTRTGSFRVADIIVYQDKITACAQFGLFSDAGGLKGSIAQWTGSEWVLLGTNAPPAVALAEFNNELYCASGPDVYKLDGSAWVKTSPTLYGTVTKLIVFQGSLYVGGPLATTQFSSTKVLLKYDGATWTTIDYPVGLSELLSMAVYKNELYLGGRFSSGLGGLRMLLAWNGTRWLPVNGLNQVAGQRCEALTVFGKLLIAGGFLQYDDATTRSRFIVGYDGESWYPLGTGIDVVTAVSVTALAPYLGRLAVGGYFTVVGKKPSIQVAIWQPDHDADALYDGVDNCPYRYNPDQADITGDGIGDACCCVGTTGDFNQSQTLDLTDLSILITILTGSYNETLPCPYETYADGYAGITLSDLSQLVAYFTQSPKPQLPGCP